VLLQGEVTVYEARGQYQLIVRAVELQGVGALQAAFERLKAKLAAEGLFAADRKRALPRFPQRIGLVTSPTGAAIRDVLHVIQRRNPALEIILAPCRVQGEGAAGEIAGAIRRLNELPMADGRWPIDLILVTRGGGSLEDLWAFNEEVVARAIFESALPVVSAVGHEIDFTISDFVADLRAATPSAAAEIITEGVFASREFLAEAAPRLRQIVGQGLRRADERFAQMAHRLALAHPRRQLQEGWQRLDDLQSSLTRQIKAGLRDRQLHWRHATERLGRVHPAQQLQQRRDTLALARRRLREVAGMRLRERHSAFGNLENQLKLLSPQQVLARGYSITTDAATGAVVREAAGVPVGRMIRTRLKSGEIRSRVEAG
jgi:exodeoxyribonuclease VII large subunit